MSGAREERPRYFAVEGSGSRELEAPEGPAWQVLDDAGAAVYEGLRTFDGSCFFGLQEHLRRLAESCRAFDGALTFEPDDVHRGLVHAGARCRIDSGVDSRVRIDVCSAPARSLGTESTVILTLVPFRGVAPEHLSRGVAVRTTRELRRERPTVKDSRWTAVRARAIAADPRLAACYEPMLVDDEGRLLEGVQSNLVLVRGDKPWTAPSRVLRGITLDAVLELSPEEAVRDFVRVERLPELTEAFLTSSVRGIVPIVEIDGVRIGAGVPGPLTRELLARYEAHVAQHVR